MFERFTEKARRTVFFARYEASQFGSAFIEPGHMLLGLLREDRALVPGIDAEAVRKELEAIYPPGERVSTSIDLPVSRDGQKIFAYAAEEAENLRHKHIGTEHMLLAFLRDESSPCGRLLRKHGVELESIRQKLAEAPSSPPETRAAKRRIEAGLKVADTTRICNGREIRTIERIQLSEDGKQLLYRIEVQGLGKSGAYEITFELGDEKKEKEP